MLVVFSNSAEPLDTKFGVVLVLLWCCYGVSKVESSEYSVQNLSSRGICNVC